MENDNELTIATVRPLPSYDEESQEAQYWEWYDTILETEIPGDVWEQSVEYILKGIEALKYDYEWTGNAISIEAPKEYIEGVRRRYEEIWGRHIDAITYKHSRIAIEWGVWLE